MRFLLAYFVLAIVMTLLTPVVHSLPSKTVTARVYTSSTGPVNDIQACIDDCYKSSKAELKQHSLISGLLESNCWYLDRATRRYLPASCSEPRDAFKRDIIKILDAGEECRKDCLKDYPTESPGFHDWGSCYEFKLNEHKAYMKECWDTAKTSVIKNQFEDTCFDIWLPRFQRGNGFCRSYPWPTDKSKGLS